MPKKALFRELKHPELRLSGNNFQEYEERFI
jgi:hypothetical protein